MHPHQPTNTIDCSTSNGTLETVRTFCQNEVSCELDANIWYFDDVCLGTYKYLEVVFVCTNLSVRPDITETLLPVTVSHTQTKTSPPSERRIDGNLDPKNDSSKSTTTAIVVPVTLTIVALAVTTSIVVSRRLRRKRVDEAVYKNRNAVITKTEGDGFTI